MTKITLTQLIILLKMLQVSINPPPENPGYAGLFYLIFSSDEKSMMARKQENVKKENRQISEVDGQVAYIYNFQEVAFLFHKLNQLANNRCLLLQKRKNQEESDEAFDSLPSEAQSAIKVEEIVKLLKRKLEQNEKDLKENAERQNRQLLKTSFSRWRTLMLKEKRFSMIKKFTKELHDQFWCLCNLQLGLT